MGVAVIPSAEYIVDHAEQAVAFFWNDIKVAARAVLRHETLTGDELSAAIREARRKTRRRFRIGDPPAFALAPLRAARDRRARHRTTALQRTRQRGAHGVDVGFTE